MSKINVTLDEDSIRIIKIVKAQNELNNNSKAINYIIHEFERDYLEMQLRPEYVEKEMQDMRKNWKK